MSFDAVLLAVGLFDPGADRGFIGIEVVDLDGRGVAGLEVAVADELRTAQRNVATGVVGVGEVQLLGVDIAAYGQRVI